MLRLKELREEKGWTMKEAAEKLGLKYTTYISYEKGEQQGVGREPGSDTLIKIADLFDVTVDYLIGKTNHRHGYYQPTSDEELRFALFDGADVDITDEMYDEVKKFAAFVALREKQKHERKG